MTELPKVFNHGEVDPKWYAFWEEIGAFRADPESGRPMFSMVIPPPNVTGSLHIGHALNQTLPDIIIRWRRMQGYDVLWLPGTDHAGIATQNVVERQLAKEKKTRHDLGREVFEARVWEWVKVSHGTITGQMRKLGSSVDWSRERFTLDESLSRAVRRVFVSLYREGLIYRGKYIVNWCPRCRTALSDLEVVHKETAGKLYYIRYPGIGGAGDVLVATTRPETMLGDTAVAVNPDDERYRDRVGQRVRLPIIGRELPIIADAFVDPAFGTGVVKVTPAHDPNDFAIGQRHNLPQVAVIGEDARMTDAAGPYASQDRFVARAGIVEQLQAEGLLEKVEDHRHAVGHCDRCGTVVEPLVSTQWFVRIRPLAEPAIKAVEDGSIDFVPENWKKTYYEWMTNIHDWCISRQLWWGHRIPAWYCDRCDSVVVTEDAPAACAGCGGPMRQETDVLDTWFSSGLWPFSTMGWPEDTDDLRRYYPTSLLITGFDIIFFWVARMIMLGLKFTGRVPFRQVYFTSLVRDAQGQKMSKSKGNVVDPLDVMDDIGADAFRFTLAALASPGMDISLSEGRLRGYRQFINKLWNASRFVLMNVADVPERPRLVREELPLIHRWILHRVSRVAGDVERSLTEYRFDVAADQLYHFFWHEYADWYIELVKPQLAADARDRRQAIAILMEVHDRILRLLHPFIPFITEEIWQQLPRPAATPSAETHAPGRSVVEDAGTSARTASGDARTITLQPFPVAEPSWEDQAAEDDMGLLQDVITTIRTVRSERGVPPSRQIRAIVGGGSDGILRREAEHIRRLANLESLEFAADVPRDPDTVRRVVHDLQVYVPLAGIVDRGAEKQRIAKDLANLQRQITSMGSKLANPMFRERADPEIVQQTEEQLRALESQSAKLEGILAELEA